VDALQLIASVLFGSGGVVGAFSLLRARRARRRGASAREQEARLGVPQWDVLTGYYQKELESLRGDMRAELEDVRQKVERLEQQRELDAAYIDLLELHIWQGKPPPPPARPQRG
jgi:hypothetical protein